MSAELAAETFPVGSVLVTVMWCAPLDKGVLAPVPVPGVKVQSPFAAVTAVPRTILVPSSFVSMMVTVLPGSALPLKLGVLSLVVLLSVTRVGVARLMPSTTPTLSLIAVMIGAAGAVVSTGALDKLGSLCPLLIVNTLLATEPPLDEG